MTSSCFIKKGFNCCVAMSVLINHRRWKSIFIVCSKQFSMSKVISLAPGRCDYDLIVVLFKLITRIDILNIPYKTVLRWMLQYLIGVLSTLVQVMAWCCQAISHYLSQCWPRSMSPYCVTRPQWVKDPNNGQSMQSSRKTMIGLNSFIVA